MKRYFLLAVISVLVGSMNAGAMPQPSFHTKGIQTNKMNGKLKPGEYWWTPHGSPSGPVVVLVDLDHQVMNVYRNGVLIGRSSVSTGTKGNSTPTGVFTILEKKVDHYSKKYDNAPMPHMQRLTWSGIAMHSGNLPGYPASHGCVRLPYDFSKHLFSVTTKGGTVIIDSHSAGNPNLAALVLAGSSQSLPAHGEYQWQPERSTRGPVTVLLSRTDRAAYVYRNGVQVGRAQVQFRGRVGDQVFTMLEGKTGRESALAPGRPGHRWMTVTENGSAREASLADVGRRVSIPQDFAHKVYDVLSPGSTINVTDAPALSHASRDVTILED